MSVREHPVEAAARFDLTARPPRSLCDLAYGAGGGLVGVRMGSYPDVLELWDVDRLVLRHELPATNGMGAALHPGGQLLATCGEEGVSLWDCVTGRETRRLAARAPTTDIVFSGDGQLLACTAAVGDDDHPSAVVEVWDWAAGELRQSFVGAVHYFMSLAFSPDGTRIAAGGNIHGSETRLMVWDLGGAKKHDVDVGHRISVYAVGFSRDGRQIATASESVRFWDAQTGRQLGEFGGLLQYGSYWSLCFLPDGRTIAACYNGHDDSTKDSQGIQHSWGLLKWWDFETGREGKQFALTDVEGITGGGPLALSPDGKYLASVVHDAMVLVWDLGENATS